MITLIGTAAVTAACTAVGIAKASLIRRQAQKAYAICEFITETRNEIRYSALACREICTKLLKKPRFAALDARDGILCEFLGGLGRTDTKGQLEYCDGFLLRAEADYNEKKKKADEQSRLFGVLGLCVGIGIAVVLI